MPFAQGIAVTAYFVGGIDTRLVGVIDHGKVVDAGNGIGNVALALKIVEDSWVKRDAGAGAGGFGDEVVEQVGVAAGIHAGVEKDQDLIQVGPCSGRTEVERVFDPLVSKGDVSLLFDPEAWAFELEDERGGVLGPHHNPELVIDAQVERLWQLGQEQAVRSSGFFGVGTHLAAGVDLERVPPCRVVHHRECAFCGRPGKFCPPFEVFQYDLAKAEHWKEGQN